MTCHCRPNAGSFFGVYMLCSKNVRYKGRIYIGFTVDPLRRITQHNRGSQFGGAARTNNRGPWEMLLIVSGFPNDISALRFEWAWQNPSRSRRLVWLPKKRLKESSLKYHLRLLDTMISSPPWIRLPLTIHSLNDEILNEIKGALANRPSHMSIAVGIPSPATLSHDDTNDDVLLTICSICNNSDDNKRTEDMSDKLDDSYVSCYHDGCTFRGHMTCLASRFIGCATHHLLPVFGDCPTCGCQLIWGKLVKDLA